MGQSQEGVNVRNPSTANLGVSSVDRYGTLVYAQGEQNPANTATLSSPYDFSIGQNQNLMNGFFTRLAVSEVQFRWTMPTLTSRNNKIYITSGGTDYLITVPEGWYDIGAGASSDMVAPKMECNRIHQRGFLVTRRFRRGLVCRKDEH